MNLGHVIDLFKISLNPSVLLFSISEEEFLSAIHEMFRLLLKYIITLFKRPRAV